MVYIRAAMATTIVLVVLLVGYMFFTFQSDISVDLATDDFLKGQYEPRPHSPLKSGGTHPLRKTYCYTRPTSIAHSIE